MRDKITIGFVRDGYDAALLQEIQDKMLERFGPEGIEFVELTVDYGHGAHPLDAFAPSAEALNRMIRNSIRLPFREAYADRIDRYNRVWPRNGCPMLPWNRKHKWLPRFYDTSKRHYFSQSLLRRSQVQSLPNIAGGLKHTVCSLEDLDLSRWP